MALVLVIDDDKNLVRVVEYNLREDGHEVVSANSAETGLEILRREPIDLVLTDIRMPGMGGMELLSRVREDWPELPVILITAFAAIDSAVEAMKAGAVDYIPKPFNQHDLKFKVAKALATRRLREENRILRQRVLRDPGLDDIIGRSEAMERVFTVVRQAAPSQATVLITGASGTGKELVARAIHHLSERAHGPWVPVNCAAIPSQLLESELFGHTKGSFTGAIRDQAGKFEQAHQGTIFLDEIADLDLALQPKLLRVLQDHQVQRIGEAGLRKVDVRVIAATKAELKERVDDGRFREDLFYRLNVIPIRLPSLAERPGDVSLLADAFLHKFAAARLTWSPEAMTRLEHYPWPGNVRELENLVERISVLLRDRSGPILTSDLPPEIAGDTAPPAPPLAAQTLPEAERELILRALDKARGNRSAAARALGIPRHVLLYRLKKFGIE